MVGVAVADRDHGRLELVGGHVRDRVVGLQERIGEDGRVALGDLEAGLAVELDLHLRCLPVGRCARRPAAVSSRSTWTAQLLVQCPAHRDANHHPHPRLLGEQGADRGDPLVRVGDGRGAQGLGFVRLAEPAALGERRRPAPSAAAARPGRRSVRPRRSARRRAAARSRLPARFSLAASIPCGAAWSPPARRGRRPRRRPGRRRSRRSGRRAAARPAPRRRPRRRSGRTPRRSPRATSARRIANQAATAPSAIPLPPAITVISPLALAIPPAARTPSAPQASSSSAVGQLPSRRSTPVAKIASPTATTNR